MYLAQNTVPHEVHPRNAPTEGTPVGISCEGMLAQRNWPSGRNFSDQRLLGAVRTASRDTTIAFGPSASEVAHPHGWTIST